ncbi:MAG TPA: D-alanyl-D-alanine carboxypeptidase [Firmicutes bacterium]|jgi:D-alanyl-D-alanine carboxypeptidase (penicillin-binding protein 5/6)|nr:D-alanyl-D-alanine carboxypeptidase [Bacillota bacterium]
MRKIYRRVAFVALFFILLSVQSTLAALPFNIQSESVVLMEVSSGEILVEKNSNKPLPPASVTKMMVMLLAMEAIDRGEIKLNDKVIASPEACRMGGSQIWLEPGEEMTVEDLMKAVGIVSANDASVALAEYISGSHEEFVKLMNNHAQELGLKNTVYVNATGLSPDGGGPGNMTSAYDQAILARELLKHPTVLKWTGTWIDSLRGGESFLRNTNNLVRFYDGCDGLKTGYTSEAGYCLVATAKRNGVRLIAVVMKAPTSPVRNNEITKLFNYGFSQFKALKVLSAGQVIGKTKVMKGRTNEVNLIMPEDLLVVLKRDTQTTPEVLAKIPAKVRAPLAQGTPVGEVIVKIDGETKVTAPLVTEAAVEESGFFRFLWQITKNMLEGFFH